MREHFTVGQAAKAVRNVRYEYDFGDSWDHDIAIEHVVSSVGIDIPHLINGARPCPHRRSSAGPGDTATC